MTDRRTIFPAENKTAPPLAPRNAESDSNIADVTIQSDVTIAADLTRLRALCQQAETARADLDNDFPVGAVARGKWQDARRAMADACPRLLDHIDDLREALNGFLARRADLRPLLYGEFNRAQRALDGDSPFNPDGN